MVKRPASTRERVTSIGVTVSGISLAIFPLALWVAWTPFVFGVVVVAGISSALVLFVMLSLQRGPDESRPMSDGAARPELPGAVVEEIHDIFPLTYHHSRAGRAPFPRVMGRLRRMLA